MKKIFLKKRNLGESTTIPSRFVDRENYCKNLGSIYRFIGLQFKKHSPQNASISSTLCNKLNYY